MTPLFRAAADPVLQILVKEAGSLAREAGSILMKYYGKNYAVEIKDDSSPVTAADTESSLFLVRELEKLNPSCPVVSEENDLDPAHEGVTRFWAVDPLDGTKEFIDQTGGFCVKIALIDKARPVLGVVYCPAHDVLYATVENGQSIKTSRNGTVEILSVRPVPGSGSLRTLFNAKHADPAEYERYRAVMADRGINLPFQPEIKAGLPRNLQVAEGLADLHLATGFGSGPMTGSGFIWDAAPDHLLIVNAGGGMGYLDDGSKPSYGVARERMRGYLAYGDPALHQKLYPGLGK